MRRTEVTMIRMLPKPDYAVDDEEQDSPVYEEEYPLEPLPDYAIRKHSHSTSDHSTSIKSWKPHNDDQTTVTVPVPPTDYSRGAQNSRQYSIERPSNLPWRSQQRRFSHGSASVCASPNDDWGTSHLHQMPRAHRRPFGRSSTMGFDEDREGGYTDKTLGGFARPRRSARLRPRDGTLSKVNSIGDSTENELPCVSTVRVLKTWLGSCEQELDILPGELLKVVEKRRVWWRCSNSDGYTGWVPAELLDDITTL